MSGIKRAINFLIYYSGMVFIFRYFYFKFLDYQPRILFFHRVVSRANRHYDFFRLLGHINSEEFEKRIKHLVKFYKIISLDEYCDKIQNGERMKRSLIMTFDDGYECFYRIVYPLLKKYNISATVFLATGFIGNNGGTLWYDELIYLIASTREKSFFCPEILEKSYKLNNDICKKKLYLDLNKALKNIDNKAKEQIMEKLFGILKVEKAEIKIENEMLTWEQVKEMHLSGLVSFGAHTESHPILTRITMNEAENEIKGSRERIKKELGCEIRLFAYPNGSTDDFSPEIKKIVRETGFSLAVTTIDDLSKNNDFYEVSRSGVNREPDFMFALRMSGVFDLVRRFRKVKNK